MIQKIKINYRQSLNFKSTILSSLAVSYFFGITINQLIENDSVPKWKGPLFGSIIVFIAMILCLYIFYYYFNIKFDKDIKEKQSFYDSFFTSLFVVIISTFMILYNNHIKIGWIISGGSLLILYFPLNWLYIKLRPK